MRSVGVSPAGIQADMSAQTAEAPADLADQAAADNPDLGGGAMPADTTTAPAAQ